MNDMITIGKLREKIGLTIGRDLVSEGFSLDNRITKAKKKINKKNDIVILFDCYDYNPVKVEFRLLLVFKISELEEESRMYYQYCNEEYSGGKSFVLCEGDFHPKVSHLDQKLRSAATHIVADSVTLKEGIEDCRKVLKDEIIPMLPKFSILKEFQNMVLNDYGTIRRLGLIIRSLMAAKLHSHKALVNLVDYLWDELKLESKSDLHIMKKLVRGIIPYSDKIGR